MLCKAVLKIKVLKCKRIDFFNTRLPFITNGNARVVFFAVIPCKGVNVSNNDYVL